MDENRKGPGIFYAVVGVATLVVAIIGATFAYFSASTPDNTEIGGETATVEALTLSVKPVATPAKGLVPQLGAGITTAVKNSCVDDLENAVCRVYRVEIKNTGTAAVASKGTLTLAADTTTNENSKFENLKWALVEGVTKSGSEDDGYNFDLSNATVSQTTNGMDTAEIARPNLAAQTGVEEYYVVVWIENLPTTDQTSKDIGSFTGTVSWAGVDGNIKVESTFIS